MTPNMSTCDSNVLDTRNLYLRQNTGRRTPNANRLIVCPKSMYFDKAVLRFWVLKLLETPAEYQNISRCFYTFLDFEKIALVSMRRHRFFFPRISVFSSHARKKKRGKKCARKSKARKNRKTARKKRVFCQTFEKCE